MCLVRVYCSLTIEVKPSSTTLYDHFSACVFFCEMSIASCYGFLGFLPFWLTNRHLKVNDGLVAVPNVGANVRGAAWDQGIDKVMPTASTILYVTSRLVTNVYI
jgi:hypothetical protein